MVKVYVRKIKNGEINAATGLPWCIDDVPDRWKDAVQKLLDEGNGTGV